MFGTACDVDLARSSGTNRTKYAYDTTGRLESANDPAGGSKTFTPTLDDPAPGVLGVVVETAEGRETTYRLEREEDLDELRTRKVRTGSSSQLVSTTLRRPDGHVVRTDPDGTVATVLQASDPHYGRMLPLPSEFSFETPGSRIFSGTFSRTEQVVVPGTGEITNQLDSLVIDKSGGTRTYQQAYNKGPTTGVRTVTTTTPELRVIADTLDVQGRLVTRQVGSLEAVRFAYDASGRLETIRQGAGAAERVTTFSYAPASGFLAGIEDPLGRDVTIDSHDPAGRPTQETLPGNRVVGFGWDANGNLTSLTPPGKPSHGFEYTPVDLESEYEPPAVPPDAPWPTATSWDGDRRLDLVSRPDATSIDLEYETPSGRLDFVTIPEGTIDLGYHPLTGPLESLSAPGGVGLDLAWDGFLLEVQTWSGPVAGSVGFDYESPGMRIVEETVNGADPIAFAYDDDDLLTGAGALTLTPHPSHGLLQDTTLGVVSTVYGYSGFGELASDSASVSGSPVYANTYTVRDKLGRIEQKTETIQGTTDDWVYTYDPAGRLDTVTRDGVPQADHAYDPNGNRLCTNETAGSCPSSAIYDEQDRLVTDEAGRAYTYSEAGELEAMTDGGEVTTYGYDPLGNLRTVTLPDATAIEYVIDALGRRIGKKVDGTLQQGFLWSDGLRIAAELDGTGAVVARFVYGTRPNVPEYLVKGGVTYRILTDHLGSARLVVNTADPNPVTAVAQRIDYDVWGNPTFTGPADFQPFGFAGGLYDPDTGLVRFGARDYDARTGRWTSKDPINFSSGTSNLYEYALLDPLSFIDPEGTAPQVAGGGGPSGKRPRGIAPRPENTANPAKKYKKDKTGRWYYKDKTTGKKIFKAPGWIPPWLLKTPLFIFPEILCAMMPNNPDCQLPPNTCDAGPAVAGGP